MNFSEVVILIVAGTSVLLILSGFIVSFIFIHRHRQQKNSQELEKMQAQFTHTLLQSQLEIQEQTLQHISNELHDNIAQVAGIIKMNLHTIPLTDTAKAAQKIEDTRELVEQVISDIRAISVNLNGDRIAQIGLSKALETEIERINKTELFTARFEQTGELLTDDGKAVILYRMVQEILNNTVKHSHAKHIRLSVDCNNDITVISVSDDGAGFATEEKLKNSAGSGLRNLKKRAALIQADLDIKSSIGNGTCIAISVPYCHPLTTAEAIPVADNKKRSGAAAIHAFPSRSLLHP